ncbi:MAG: hypothetical protein HY392_01675 [Candidatus Diapherotrites archaeon]|nr:hypothetical protein [Candidatus Diapherotrites archaeon]
MLNKGFLGPIGDDLPSLIPLLFALLIFFATFSFSYSTFSQKNTGFQRDLDVLNIARVLKGTNYVSGYQAFLDSCNSLNPTNLKYRAVITNYFTATTQYLGLPDAAPKEQIEAASLGLKSYMLEPFSVTVGTPPDDEKKPLECRVDASGLNPGFFSETPFVVKIYPLVVEDDRVVKPMHLVVVAWTK